LHTLTYLETLKIGHYVLTLPIETTDIRPGRLQHTRMQKTIHMIPLLKTMIIICFLGFVYSNACAQKEDENAINVEFEKTSLMLNEPFKVKLIFPKSFKKEFKLAQTLVFPEITDMSKGPTIIDERTEQTITQWYWPRKAGAFTFPNFSFTVKGYDIEIPSTPFKIENKRSSEKFEVPKNNEPWVSQAHHVYFSTQVSKKTIFEKETFSIDVSIQVPLNNSLEWNMIDLDQQIQQYYQKISAAGFLLKKENRTQLMVDTIELNNTAYLQYHLMKGYATTIDSMSNTIPSLNYKFITYKYKTVKTDDFTVLDRVTQEQVLQSNDIQINTIALTELGERSVGNFKAQLHMGKEAATVSGFSVKFDIIGNPNIIPLADPMIINDNELLEISLTQRTNTIKNEQEITSFHYYIHAKQPMEFNFSQYIKWPYFNVSTKKYDTLSSSKIISILEGNRVQSSDDFENKFEELLFKANNQVSSLEKEESLNRFANIIIFVLFVAISILIFKR
jgi:hypothetical protein